MGEMDIGDGMPDEALTVLADHPRGDDRPSGEMTLADIHALWRSGDGVRAMDAALVLLETDRENPELWDILVRLMRAVGDVEQALASVTTAIWLCPHVPGLSVLRGDLLRAVDRDVEAEGAYRMALILDPDHAGARNALVSLLHAMDRRDDALSVLCELVPEPVAQARLLTLTAQSLREQNEDDAALDVLRQALALVPERPEPCAQLGHYFMAMGQERDAVVWFRRAAALDPTVSSLQLRLGLTALDIGQDGVAEDAFRRAIVAAPHESNGYLQLGKVLRGAMRSEEARTVLARAGRLDPVQTSSDAILTGAAPWIVARSAWQVL